MTIAGYAWVLFIVGGAALVMFLTRNLGRLRTTRYTTVKGETPDEAAKVLPRPSNQLPILHYEDLLGRTGTAGFIHQIENRTGFAPENFERDCLPVLRRVADYVQLFPASEAHHHAREGGLLIHLLETAAYALHFREGVELPLAAPPEERERLKHRWTYGVFLAAMLHDIGKPLADLRIALYRSDRSAATMWHAFAGAVTDTPGATHYTVEFASPSERDYDEHRRLAYSLVQSFVPQHARLWLAEDAVLMRELAGYLSGEMREGAIAAIVRRADAESVRHDLRHGPRTRFASARTVPLIERLMGALRRMLAEGGHLPLNKPGAAAWVYRGDIWFVSKRMADTVREYLNRHEQRRDEAPGIPESNERLFDAWVDYGACTANPETGGAVWTAVIEMPEFRQRLTLLRFPLTQLYLDSDHFPAELDGRIEVLSKNEYIAPETDVHQQADTEAVSRTERPALDNPAEPCALRNADGSALKSRSEALPAFPPAISTSDVPSPVIAERSVVFLDEADCATRALDSEPTNATAPPLAPSAPVAPAATRTAAELLGDERRPLSKSKETALRFFAWIQQGLADGTLKYNVAEARIHFVPEGMLMVSPATFRDFAAAFGDVGASVSPDPDGKERLGNGIQNAVKRSGFVVLAAKGSYLHRYQVLRNGAPSGSILNCFLMPHPEHFFNPVPAANPLLKRFTPQPSQDVTRLSH